MKEELHTSEDNSWKAHGEQCFRFLVQYGEELAFSSIIRDRMILVTGP